MTASTTPQTADLAGSQVPSLARAGWRRLRV
jgi:hypothetical protein